MKALTSNITIATNRWDNYFFDSIRFFSDSYEISQDHEETIFNFLSTATEYFRNAKNYKGVNFCKKYLLRCLTRKAIYASNLKAFLRIEQKADALIEVTTRNNVFQPSYIKLKCQIIYAQAEVANSKGLNELAVEQILRAIAIAEDLVVEFPHYTQAKDLLVELKQFKSTL